MAGYTLKVEYMGAVRLLIGKKDEMMDFSKPPTPDAVLEAIAGRYGEQAVKECRKQLFVYYPKGQSAGRVVTSGELLEDRSLVRVVSMVTGG